MKIFAYGSLMNQESLTKTIPEARILELAILKGYKRVFDFKSPYRKNPETNVYSSVLNIVKDSKGIMNGLVIEIPEHISEKLVQREQGYGLVKVEVTSNNGELMRVSTFVGEKYEHQEYIANDPVQYEYLQECIDAIKPYGPKALEMFLDTTFSGEETISKYLTYS